MDINKMQYGFMLGKGTVDAIFSLRRLAQKFRSFDQVPRESICFALRQKGASEYLVNKVMSMYQGCKSVISV